MVSLEDYERSVVLATRARELAPAERSVRLAVPAPAVAAGRRLVVRAAFVTANGTVHQECADVVFAQQAPQRPAALAASPLRIPGIGGPLHASCKLTWTFAGQQCAVRRALAAASWK